MGGKKAAQKKGVEGTMALRPTVNLYEIHSRRFHPFLMLAQSIKTDYFFL